MPSLVRLVPAGPQHVDAWLALRQGATARRFMPLEDDSREALLQRLLHTTADLTDTRAQHFRWMVERQGRVVGTVAARDLDRVQGHVEVGYMLGEAHLGKGYGTRAVGLLLDTLFAGVPSLHRVFLLTAHDNLASQALARKLGFVREGVLRQHYLIRGVRKDGEVWGVLRPEWRERRTALLL